jgi:hypothetical protein
MTDTAGPRVIEAASEPTTSAQGRKQKIQTETLPQTREALDISSRRLDGQRDDHMDAWNRHQLLNAFFSQLRAGKITLASSDWIFTAPLPRRWLWKTAGSSD